MYREHENKKLKEFIEKVGHIGDAVWQLSMKYSVTGLPETRKFSETTNAHIWATLLLYGIKKKDLKPFLEDAQLLVEEHFKVKLQKVI